MAQFSSGDFLESGSVSFYNMHELLDELNVAKGCGTMKKVINQYKKVDLLIIDEWLIKRLTQQESYDMLEIIEAKSQKGSMIFCTQYDSEEWYDRINTDTENDSPISDAIMDRIVHNAYPLLIQGKKSMRERHGLNLNNTSDESKKDNLN